jgi:hypothetical protein
MWVRHTRAMRHLTEHWLRRAIESGPGAERLLPARTINGRRTIRWLTAWRDRNGRLVLNADHVYESEGYDGYGDVTEFARVFSDADGSELVGRYDTTDALLAAAGSLGADVHGWVSQGLVGEEYADAWRAEQPRPPQAPFIGHPPPRPRRGCSSTWSSAIGRPTTRPAPRAPRRYPLPASSSAWVGRCRPPRGTG